MTVQYRPVRVLKSITSSYKKDSESFTYFWRVEVSSREVEFLDEWCRVPTERHCHRRLPTKSSTQLIEVAFAIFTQIFICHFSYPLLVMLPTVNSWWSHQVMT